MKHLFSLEVWNPWHPSAGHVRPHLSLITVLVFLAGTLAGVLGTKSVEHFQAHAGLIPPKHLPPATHVRLGGIVPQSWSLDQYVYAVHNQGSSNSCVGQTISSITEIEAAERGVRQSFSAGYIYDQTNGGTDGGTTYDQAFALLQQQGDAPSWAFPHDGTDWWVLPDWNAHVAAYPWRSSGWHYIQPRDRATIQYYISHGVPIAFAAPWYDSWVQHYYNGSALPYPSGNQQFWHSTILDSYSPYGVLVLNSWSGAWGSNGRAWVSWDLLAYMQSLGAFAAVSDTVYPHPHPKPHKPKLRPKFPFSRWSSYTKHVSPYDHGKHLRWEAQAWWRGHVKSAGPVISAPQYFKRAKHRRNAYVTIRFANQRYYWWPGHRGWQKWIRVHHIGRVR